MLTCVSVSGEVVSSAWNGTACVSELGSGEAAGDQLLMMIHADAVVTIECEIICHVLRGRLFWN